MPLELLSRIQFAFTISFHILYPAFSIGLITFIAFFEARYLKTRKPEYLSICKFWTKILALTFGMGIVSGIVMEFQLGTNWSNFTHTSGNVLGVLFTYEVLTAFFIEAGFLGVMFFGWNRVSPEFHFIATLLALIGVTVSAFWIMSANSWMQFPTGVTYSNHVFTVVSWFETIFNPLFLPRFFHMLVATYISSFLVIIAVSAYYLSKKRHSEFAKTCFKNAFIFLAILIPLQLFLGDHVGLKIHTYQPIKTAAMEAVWDTEKGAPLVLFAIPSQQQEKNLYEIAIPRLAALLNTHHLNGELMGLKAVAPSDRPYVPFVFFSFRAMVGMWILLSMLLLYGGFLAYRKKFYTSPFFLKICMLFAPLGFLSIITGWFTAEFGRQPWIIYNVLRTKDAHSPIHLQQIIISLFSIVIVYGVIFGFFYFKYFFKIIATGPEEKISKTDETFLYLSPPVPEPKKPR